MVSHIWLGLVRKNADGKATGIFILVALRYPASINSR